MHAEWKSHRDARWRVDVLEISYTNNNAGEVIGALKEKFGDQLLVGAGTVLDPTTARLAIMDGAEFIIAPTFNKEVQEMANLYRFPMHRAVQAIRK